MFDELYRSAKLLAAAEEIGLKFIPLSLRRQLARTKGVIPSELLRVAASMQENKASLRLLCISVGAKLLARKEYDAAEWCFLCATDEPTATAPALISILIYRLLAETYKASGQLAAQIAALRRAALVLPQLNDAFLHFTETVGLAYDFFDLGEKEEANRTIRGARLTPDIAKILKLNLDLTGAERVDLSIITGKRKDQ